MGGRSFSEEDDRSGDRAGVDLGVRNPKSAESGVGVAVGDERPDEMTPRNPVDPSGEGTFGETMVGMLLSAAEITCEVEFRREDPRCWGEVVSSESITDESVGGIAIEAGLEVWGEDEAGEGACEAGTTAPGAIPSILRAIVGTDNQFSSAGEPEVEDER